MVVGALYHIDNEEWTPVGGTWLSSSANSDHGKRLLRYFKEGVIAIDTKPQVIWSNHPEFRLVNPYNKGCNFRKFVNKISIVEDIIS